MATYRPTQAMQRNAQRGLDLRARSTPSARGGTAVGLARARQFASGSAVSLETVKRTFSFLSRAETYYQPGRNTPGTQAYLLWGGPAGLTWARRILASQSA
jgi:hypothetical protein